MLSDIREEDVLPMDDPRVKAVHAVGRRIVRAVDRLQLYKLEQGQFKRQQAPDELAAAEAASKPKRMAPRLGLDPDYTALAARSSKPALATTSLSLAASPSAVPLQDFSAYSLDSVISDAEALALFRKAKGKGKKEKKGKGKDKDAEKASSVVQEGSSSGSTGKDDSRGRTAAAAAAAATAAAGVVVAKEAVRRGVLSSGKGSSSAEKSEEAAAAEGVQQSGSDSSKTTATAAAAPSPTPRVITSDLWQWKFLVVDSPVCNAFCSPGGLCVVFTGMLAAIDERVRLGEVPDRESALATIMSHEIAHAVLRHSAERYISLPLILFSNWVEESSPLLTSMIRLLVERPFSRMHESEADTVGMVLLTEACYDPFKAPAFYASMHSTEESQHWFSTHPADKRRAESAYACAEVLDTFSRSSCKGQSFLRDRQKWAEKNAAGAAAAGEQEQKKQKEGEGLLVRLASAVKSIFIGPSGATLYEGRVTSELIERWLTVEQPPKGAGET